MQPIPLFCGATTMPRACARHILVKTREEADKLKTQLDNGADFSRLAQKFSQCPSKKNGGSLGEFNKGDMVKAFDDVVFKGPVLKVQGPVKTQFGFHLIETIYRN
jgi:peptidyl-prolyl cis-trans isomerase C